MSVFVETDKMVREMGQEPHTVIVHSRSRATALRRTLADIRPGHGDTVLVVSNYRRARELLQSVTGRVVVDETVWHFCSARTLQEISAHTGLQPC